MEDKNVSKIGGAAFTGIEARLDAQERQRS